MATPNFDHAARDLVTVSDVANSPNPTTVTRMGETIPTLRGALNSVMSTGGFTKRTLPELLATTPPEGTSPTGRVTEGPGAGFYVWENGAWEETDDPLEAYYSALATMIAGKLDRNLLNLPGYLFAVADKNGNLSDLAVDDETGQFADFVVRRLKRRINGIVDIGDAAYPQTFGTTHEIVGKDMYRHPTTGEILPVLIDMTKLAGWGSSSMEKSATAMAALANELGMTYYQGGVSGQATSQIAARIGSIPAKVTFPSNTIPASGSTAVTVSNVGYHTSVNYLGSIAGVSGRLFIESGWKFERTTAGAAVSVDQEAPFLPTGGAANRAGINIVWMGRNNLGGADGQVQKCVEDTDASFDWFSSWVCRRLVMGHFTGNLAPSNAAFQQVLQVNAAHKKRYANLFIDVQAYLSSSSLWFDTGITPTSADQAAQAVGTTPPSALIDNQHLTPLVYSTIVQKLVKQRMLDLGWFYTV